ncbi:LuxR C-terminal-related transcriptional regulator [Streptomyces sp. NPDC091280]|uniref:helix-turn-helix transcriptional regulator n=1 Tax=Streptomyces sp. NPDC091280 TaxID=3365984 RepID=UPI0037F90783
MPEHALTKSVGVAVYSLDPLERAALADFLTLDARLHEVPWTRAREADAVVMAMDTADDSVLGLLPAVCHRPDACFLLLVRAWDADVSVAHQRGVRAVLRRGRCTARDLAAAVHTAVERDSGLLPVFQSGLPGPEPQTSAAESPGVSARSRTASKMSPRELAVLGLIAEGRQISEIATELSYSERTVKYVLYGAMKRLGVRSRPHAVSYAIRAGLI